MARDLALWQGASKERYPQRSLTERATPPQGQRSDRNVAYPDAQAVCTNRHPGFREGALFTTPYNSHRRPIFVSRDPSRSDARIAMMAITTSSSMSVTAARIFRNRVSRLIRFFVNATKLVRICLSIIFHRSNFSAVVCAQSTPK